MGMSGRLEVRSSFQFTSSSPTTTVTSAISTIEQADDYSDGTGSGQAQYAYSKEETSSVLVAYDLVAGGLKDSAGNSIAFAKVKSVVVRNTSTTISLYVGGGSNPLGLMEATGDRVKVPPGGVFVWECPAGVATSGSAKTLSIEPTTATSCTWQVQVVGNN